MNMFPDPKLFGGTQGELQGAYDLPRNQAGQ